MFDNQFNITPNGGLEPQNLCPCIDNGCTHACSATTGDCFRGCGNSCSLTCLANCTYALVFQL